MHKLSLAEIICGITVYHLGAINGLSLITGRAGSIGFLDDNSLLLGKMHATGVGLAILAIGVIYVSMIIDNFAVGLVIATGLMFGDLFCILRMFRR